MKTARFSEVVKTAGKPEVHLLLTNPALDPVLQKAVKGGRVMTLHQPPVGNQTDFGTVGLLEGVKGQVLIFPRSIKDFADRNIVGIHYDLLKEEPVSRRKPRAFPPPPRAKRSAVTHKTSPEEPPIIPFPTTAKAEAADEIRHLKAQVRKALAALDAGKQVAAYKLLQPLVED